MTTTSSNNFTGLYGDGNATVNPGTAYGNANVVSLLATSTDGANTVGNISATGTVTAAYFAGDGSQLTNINAGNIVGGYGNANVSAYLASGTNTANILTSGNVSGAYILGNGSQLTGLPATYGNANVVANLAALGSNPVSTTGNISAGYLFGNGSQLSGLPATYGNANVAAFLPTYTGNLAGGNLSVTGTVVTQGTISATGNIETAGYFVGNFQGNISGNIAVTGSNTQVLFNNQGNVGAVGGFTYDKDSNVMTVLGTVSAQANVIGGNVNTTGTVTAGSVSATGNVTGAYVIGNGSLLSNIAGANVTGTVATAAQATYATTANAVAGANVSGTVANATQAVVADTANAVAGGNVTGNVANAVHAYSADSANSVSGSNVSGAVANAVYATTAGVASTVTANAQANITSVGTLTSLSATGNISTNSFFIGNGSQLTGVTGTYGNTDVRNYLASGTNTANIITTGNISGAYILGDGSQLTGLPATYGNANVATFMAAFGSNAVSTTGNVSAGYFVGNGSQLTGVVATSIGTLPSLSVTGNINSGNVNSTFFGSGAGLTNITGGNVTGTVSSATTAGTVTANAQANITSVGVLTSLSVSGNTQSGNLLSLGTVSATGNIAGSYFIGNGSLLTGISAGTNYSNANVAAFLPVYGANIISGTGNITGGNLISNGMVSVAGKIDGQSLVVSGGITAVGSQIQIGTVNATGTISTLGNVVANNISGNGSGITGVTANVAQYVTANAQANITSVGTLTSLTTTGKVAVSVTGNAIWTSGNLTSGNIDTGKITSGLISAQGNITATAGFYFQGDGSLLTGIVGSYSNAQVAVFLADFGSNTVSTTGNITSGNFITGGLVSATGNVTGGNIRTVGQVSVTGNITGGNVATGNLNAGNLRTSGLVTATGNITTNDTLFGTTVIVTTASASGNVIGGNLTTTGIITATGNIQGGNINVPGGSITSSIVSATGTITGGNLRTPGSISATGNITGGNVDTGNVNSGNLRSSGIVTATGNITTAAYFIGDGSLITNLPLGGYGNANVANFLANYGSNVISGTGNITGSNIRASGFVSAAGNIAATGWVFGNAGGSFNNPVFSTEFSATGNITGNYFIGNGSALTGVSASAGGANTQIQFNNASAFAGNANLTFNNATGNVNLGNLIITTSNATNFINTVAPLNGIPANSVAFSNSQIIIGNGWAGNLNPNNHVGPIAARGSKLLIWDTMALADSGGPRASGLGVSPMFSLTGNISNTNTRLSGISSIPIIGGGASNYQLTTASQFAFVGVSSGTTVGQPNTTVAIGNTVVTNSTGIISNMAINGASNVGNSMGLYTTNGVSTAGYVQNTAGLVVAFTGTPTVASSNVYGVYMNGNTSQGIFNGTLNSNGMRKADNYYFLRNDDNLAQNKLGSLRLFNEYQYDNTSSSGTLTVDKNNGQVQSVVLSENITTVTFSNFVTSASDGTTTDYQTDTVTLILRQGATPYTVTMPSGSAYRYAAGANTVGATANAVTMISVTANYDSISAADQYLITISPEFS